MHQSIRGDLERLLERAPVTQEVQRHLDSCGECAVDLGAMRAQKTLFRSVRIEAELEPAPGFYARVMQRIEESAKDSIWAVFIYSPFGKRLALASLSLALVFGSYVVAEERIDGHLVPENGAVHQLHYDVPMQGDQAQLRDAVLQNFAAHESIAR